MDKDYKVLARELQVVMSNLNADNLGKGIEKEHNIFKKGCKLVGKVINLLEKRDSLFYKIKSKIPGLSFNLVSDNLQSFIESESDLLKEVGISEKDIYEGLKRITQDPITNVEPDYDETIEVLREFQCVLCMSYLISKEGDKADSDLFKIMSDGLFDVIVILVDVPLLKIPVIETYLSSIGSIYAGTKSLVNNIDKANWKFEVISTEKDIIKVKEISETIIRLKKFKDSE